MVDDSTGLTLAEQVALTAGHDYWHLVEVPRLGVPAILVADGPHGLRKQRVSDGFTTESVPATCFPTASALAASWDLELLTEIGAALGAEARAEGVSVLLGPGVNIKRTAVCGRNFEYFSEDPFLSSRLAAAWIRGVQSTGVGASIKHFAANNQEHRRYTVDALIDERALRELYLASFEFAIREARPATVMAAYNRLNGSPCTAHSGLLLDILRAEWGFDGLVVSDWGATVDRVRGLANGLDLAMPGFAGAGDDEVLAAVDSGDLPAEAVIRAAEGVLRLAERTRAAREPSDGYDRAAHHELARRAAIAGTVLLRNEEATLPLPATGSIAVIGEFAQRPRYQGAGSSGVTPHRLDTLWDGLVAQLGADRLRYAPGYRIDGEAAEIVYEDLLAQAREAARAADVAVVIVGLPSAYETEGLDRTHINLPPSHNALVEAVAAVARRVVVVLANGAPVALPWAGRVGAIVEGYLGGQAGGSAMAAVLTGAAEPGGRLAETFPHALGDHPVHAMSVGPSTVEYRESLYVGYRYYDTAGVEVAFPFGHGLSFTTFAWGEATATTEGEITTVAITLTNTGDRAGQEVVQVYVHPEHSTVYRPEQELKGFALVRLAPGQAREVTIALDRRAFAFWEPARSGWAVEPGFFELRVGASSRDIRATVRVERSGESGPFTAGPAAYHQVGPTFGAGPFAELYGRPVPPNERDRNRRYSLETPLGDIRHPAVRLLLAGLKTAARRTFRSSRDNPMVLVVDRLLNEAPPRMLPMISQNRITLDAARSLVDLANGRTRAGLSGIVGAIRRGRR